MKKIFYLLITCLLLSVNSAIAANKIYVLHDSAWTGEEAARYTQILASGTASIGVSNCAELLTTNISNLSATDMLINPNNHLYNKSWYDTNISAKVTSGAWYLGIGPVNTQTDMGSVFGVTFGVLQAVTPSSATLSYDIWPAIKMRTEWDLAGYSNQINAVTLNGGTTYGMYVSNAIGHAQTPIIIKNASGLGFNWYIGVDNYSYPQKEIVSITARWLMEEHYAARTGLYYSNHTPFFISSYIDDFYFPAKNPVYADWGDGWMYQHRVTDPPGFYIVDSLSKLHDQYGSVYSIGYIPRPGGAYLPPYASPLTKYQFAEPDMDTMQHGAWTSNHTCDYSSNPATNIYVNPAAFDFYTHGYHHDDGLYKNPEFTDVPNSFYLGLPDSDSRHVPNHHDWDGDGWHMIGTDTSTVKFERIQRDIKGLGIGFGHWVAPGGNMSGNQVTIMDRIGFDTILLGRMNNESGDMMQQSVRPWAGVPQWTPVSKKYPTYIGPIVFNETTHEISESTMPARILYLDYFGTGFGTGAAPNTLWEGCIAALKAKFRAYDSYEWPRFFLCHINEWYSEWNPMLPGEPTLTELTRWTVANGGQIISTREQIKKLVITKTPSYMERPAYDLILTPGIGTSITFKAAYLAEINVEFTGADAFHPVYSGTNWAYYTTSSNRLKFRMLRYAQAGAETTVSFSGGVIPHLEEVRRGNNCSVHQATYDSATQKLYVTVAGIGGSTRFGDWDTNQANQYVDLIIGGVSAGSSVMLDGSAYSSSEIEWEGGKMIIHAKLDKTNQDFYDEYAFVISAVSDTTPPFDVPVVRDGTGVTDLAATYSITQLSANWDVAVDTESGISKYYYGIGTTAGGLQTLGWTSVTASSVTKTGLVLSTGTVYYFTVKAENGMGMQSAGVRNSSGITVVLDTSPPTAPSFVYDGLVAGIDLNSTNSLNQLSANWVSSADEDTGISKYLYAIGTTPGASDTLSWTDNSMSTYVIKGSLTLSKGTTYYFTVKAVNGSGTEGSATNSNGQYIENNAVATYLISGNVGISGVQMTLAGSSVNTFTTGLNGSYLFNNVPAGNYTLTPVKPSYIFVPLNIVYNNLSADATNQNFIGSVVVSTEDVSPPVDIANVFDGLGDDINETTDNTQLSANWDASLDPQSSIARYWYAIGTSAGASDILNWTATTDGTQTSVIVTNLNLANGTYFFSVYAENGVGIHSSTTTSNGIIIAGNSSVYIDLSQVKFGPNPIKISRSGGGAAQGSAMKFTKLPANSQLMIYTLSGKLVRTLNESSTEISFDGKNTNGDTISQGVYLYVIKTPGGLKKTGKIAVKVE